MVGAICNVVGGRGGWGAICGDSVFGCCEGRAGVEVLWCSCCVCEEVSS